MEPIDYFKYKALLAELNSNKDSKVGMTKFINKVYKLSQQLIFTNGFKESKGIVYWMNLLFQGLKQPSTIYNLS